MKLSTRGRYSTRLMLELAIRYDGGPILLREVSKAQKISLKYLGQLIIPLKIAGLIKSARGYHGGYYLSRSPENIKLSDILGAVEGSLAFTECVDSPEICYRSGNCPARNIWKKSSEQFKNMLNSITLADMIDGRPEISS
jgi:Rrf2 family protein